MASGRQSRLIPFISSAQKRHAFRASPFRCFGHGGSPRLARGSLSSMASSLCTPRLLGSPSAIWRAAVFCFLSLNFASFWLLLDVFLANDRPALPTLRRNERGHNCFRCRGLLAWPSRLVRLAVR